MGPSRGGPGKVEEMRAGYTDRPAPKHEPCDPRMISGVKIHTDNQIHPKVPPSSQDEKARVDYIEELLAKRAARAAEGRG